MTRLDEVLIDLAAESAQLDGWVSSLDAAGWATVTTPEGWTVAHQIGHLHWTDDASLTAITDPAAFAELLEAAAADATTDLVDRAAADLARQPHEQLLTAWRDGRAELDRALRSAEGKIPWFGPPMSATSMATARFMETWAHGHDVAEALGIEVRPTERVRHVCHLGVRTFGFAHAVRGEPIPDAAVRVELRGPDGSVWTWGDEHAENRVTGQAWDFALLGTRRRHRDDVDVHAEGPVADHWLDIVQTFAGPPGTDPIRLADR
ncbi:MAG TPA: TIGR03084 family metal-binding protein [Aeromicrobium sp.]|nr:TIGR03084 family metal-binding protein [Aeromicrobium sp.]